MNTPWRITHYMIRIVATDVDGTVVKESAGSINPEYYEVIRKLHKQGIQVVIASGRPYSSLFALFAPVRISSGSLQMVARHIRRRMNCMQWAKFHRTGSKKCGRTSTKFLEWMCCTVAKTWHTHQMSSPRCTCVYEMNIK